MAPYENEKWRYVLYTSLVDISVRRNNKKHKFWYKTDQLNEIQDLVHSAAETPQNDMKKEYMSFDLTNTITQSDGLKIEYGIINGNGHVVIIKAGSGGSHVGDQEKYLKIARRLHDAHGCTVICLSNFSTDSFERADVDVIRDAISDIDGETRLYYIGNSNGATQGLLSATKHFSFQRMVLFNMPLMLNFHKIKDAMTRVDAEIRFVYGEKDPSYDYVPFLGNASHRDTCLARVEIETIPGADHNFAGMTDTFVELGMHAFNL